MTAASVNLSRDGKVQMNWNQTFNSDLNSFDRHDYCLVLFYKELVSIRNYVEQYIIVISIISDQFLNNLF